MMGKTRQTMHRRISDVGGNSNTFRNTFFEVQVFQIYVGIAG